MVLNLCMWRKLRFPINPGTDQSVLSNIPCLRDERIFTSIKKKKSHFNLPIFKMILSVNLRIAKDLPCRHLSGVRQRLMFLMLAKYKTCI